MVFQVAQKVSRSNLLVDINKINSYDKLYKKNIQYIFRTWSLIRAHCKNFGQGFIMRGSTASRQLHLNLNLQKPINAIL